MSDEKSQAAAILEQQIAANMPEMDADLRQSLARLGASLAKEKAQEAKQPADEAKPKALKKADVIQLPFWPEDKRGTPNCFLRSALFSAIYGNAERKYLKNALLAVQGDVSITYTGEQLSQSDLDVVMAALHLARQQPLGHVCLFRGYTFLKILGRSDNKDNYRWLNATFDRLIACLVRIRLRQQVFTGSILSSCTRDEASDIYKLVFDPDFVKLFGRSDWTAVDWSTRQRLTRSPLAQWIYDYAVSHVGTVVKLETLQRLSGREGDTPKVFNQAFQRAKAMLEKTADIAMVLDAAGLVSIEHTLSPAQQRHVAKRSKAQMEAFPATTPVERCLRADTQEAFRAAWPRLDPAVCKTAFDLWLAGKTQPQNYDRAFLGFAAKWAKDKSPSK
jgi:hypothetical protein